MKIKQVNVSSAFAWSTLPQEPHFIATGSVAGAMGDDFSAEAQVEIYHCDVHSDADSMPVVGSTSVHDRLFRMDWSPHGPSKGLIAGALVEGTVVVWDAAAIMEKREIVEACTIKDAHKASVKALQFNPNANQSHLLATAGQDRELKIWNLQNPTSAAISLEPTAQKNPHATDVTDVKWNPKFAHIIACATSGGPTHVWDLKAKRNTVTFQDSTHKAAVTSIAWHPETPTQVCVATDAASPVIQLWDLRRAMTPIRSITGHSAGILSLSWCTMDPNLLLSCGRDGRTVCWNPNTGDLLSELPVQGNWVFDVQWSPIVPSLFATSSFDNSLSVFSMQGSGTTPSEVCASASLGATAPKWLKRPCGATFAFGGRLLGFSSASQKLNLQTAAYNNDLIDAEKKVDKLVSARAEAAEFAMLCRDNATNASQENEKLTWNVLATINSNNARAQLSEILGFNLQSVKEAAAKFVENPASVKDAADIDFLIKKCLLCGHISDAAECCMAAKRYDDALAIAGIGSLELQMSIRKRYTQIRNERAYMRVLGALYDRDITKFASTEDLQETPWQQLLICSMAYCDQQTVVQTCETLGLRLEGCESELGAQLCHMSSGNVDNVVRLWSAELDKAISAASQSAAEVETALQHFVHKVSIYEALTNHKATSDKYAKRLASYSEVLASLGLVEPALRYARRTSENEITAATNECKILLDRLQQNVARLSVPTSAFPFPREGVVTEHRDEFLPTSQQPQPQQPQQSQPQQLQPGHHHVDPMGALPVHSHGPTGHYAHVPHGQPMQPGHVVPQNPNPMAYSPAATTPVAAPLGQPQPVCPTPTAPAPVPVTSAPAPVPVPASVQPPHQHNTVLKQATMSSTTAGLSATLSAVDVSCVPPDQSEIIHLLSAAVNQVSDKRKRDSIEKALIVLFTSLNERKIPNDVAQQLLRFSRTLGSPEAKEIVKTLGTDHWEVFKPFMNIKFL